MVELYLLKETRQTSEHMGDYYPRVDYKETYDVAMLAKHMAEHNTPFSEGTIRGILTDMVKCIRELTLNGNVVKIENLALFKCSLQGNPTKKLYDKDRDLTIRAAIGAASVMKGGVKVPTGNAVKSMKLLAQATGSYTREELNKAARLQWTDKTQKQIAEAKAAAEEVTGNGD